MGAKSVSYSEVPEKYREIARAALKDYVASDFIVTDDVTSVPITQRVVDNLNFYAGGTLDESDYEHLRSWTFSDVSRNDPKHSLASFYGFADWARSRGFEVPHWTSRNQNTEAIKKPPGPDRPAFKPEEYTRVVKRFFVLLRDLQSWKEGELEYFDQIEAAYLGVASRAPQYLTPGALEEIFDYFTAHPEELEALFYDTNMAETESLLLLGVDGCLDQTLNAKDDLYESMDRSFTGLPEFNQIFADSMNQESSSGVLFFNLYGVWALWDKGLQDYL